MSITKSITWQKLKNLAQPILQKKFFLKQQFESNLDRALQMSIYTPKIIMDYSRQLVTSEIIDNLIHLANEANLKEKIEAMFNGEKINITENRAVLHTALRNFSNNPVFVDGKDVMPQIKSVLNKIEGFTNKVHSGDFLGSTGKKIRNIVSIGIGGSYLGPEYLAEACVPFAKDGMKLFFVANVDGTDFIRKTAFLNPEETLFVIISKTFTTAETIKNAQTAKRWLTSRLGDHSEVIRKHFIAVSTNEQKVREFGIDTKNMFEFWDFVGGRFSATSAVGGVPLSLYLGFDNFKRILEGAYYMDCHFRSEPFQNNIPVMSALLDIWNINFLGFNTRAILPYAQAYSKYAPHCQQTEMESNGKSVLIDGTKVDFNTGEIVFGEPGTNGQHSFYQLLHQGTNIIPADFIGFIKPQYDFDKNSEITHHEELMSNFFAQPDALAFGQESENPHRFFSGNRPSTIYLLKEQDPFSAGLLLALLEHRVAVKGFIWGINSFDQFGVELGKKLGIDIRERISRFKSNCNAPNVYEGLNSSTEKLLRVFLQGNL